MAEDTLWKSALKELLLALAELVKAVTDKIKKENDAP